MFDMMIFGLKKDWSEEKKIQHNCERKKGKNGVYFYVESFVTFGIVIVVVVVLLVRTLRKFRRNEVKKTQKRASLCVSSVSFFFNTFLMYWNVARHRLLEGKVFRIIDMIRITIGYTHRERETFFFSYSTNTYRTIDKYWSTLMTFREDNVIKNKLLESKAREREW